jgi:hypothetical protein
MNQLKMLYQKIDFKGMILIIMLTSGIPCLILGKENIKAKVKNITKMSKTL